MPQELGLPKYFDLNATEPGTQLVFMGKYIGESQGKFGPQHRFCQLEDNQEVVISGGQLNWRVEQGHIALGDVLDIYYEGKEILESGPYKGKETNNYKFAKYSRAELKKAGYEDIFDEGLEVPAAVVNGSSGAPQAQPLDDLE